MDNIKEQLIDELYDCLSTDQKIVYSITTSFISINVLEPQKIDSIIEKNDNLYLIAFDNDASMNLDFNNVTNINKISDIDGEYTIENKDTTIYLSLYDGGNIVGC